MTGQRYAGPAARRSAGTATVDSAHGGTRDEGALRLVKPRVPYVFAFALGGPEPPLAWVTQGERFVVAVRAASPLTLASDDWFLMRLPPPSPITGPVHVAGVAAGETLDIVLEEVAAASGSASAPLIVTIGAAAHVGHPGRHALQVATSVPGYVRLPALLEGGMLSFGPVLAERDVQGERLWEPVAARVTARCGVTRQHGS